MLPTICKFKLVEVNKEYNLELNNCFNIFTIIGVEYVMCPN